MNKKLLPIFVYLWLTYGLANALGDEYDKIKLLQPKFRNKIIILLEQAREQFPDHHLVVAETYRSQERQDKLYKKGSSVTTVRVSKHTKELACDIYFTNGKRILKYNEAPYLELGKIAEGLGLTWGGRWNVPFDPGHFEYKEDK